MKKLKCPPTFSVLSILELVSPMSPTPASLPAGRAAFLGLLLVSVALAGCTDRVGRGSDASTLYAGFDQALAADGLKLIPAQAQGAALDDPARDVRVRLLSPLGFQALSTGPSDVALLLYDQREAAPVEDATVRLDAGAVSAPLEHDAHGVYAGTVELPTPGARDAEVEILLADGTDLTFHLTIAAYGSADDALAADGLTYAPIEGDAALRLKLLHPEEPLDVGPGVAPFTFLLYRDGDQGDMEGGAAAAQGEPVVDADASLRSWMPPHGGEPAHGTHSEVAPVHHRLGIYQGVTNLVMNGTWWTNVTVTLGDGAEAQFRVTSDVGHGSHTHGGDGDGDDGDDHDGHAHSVSFSSFREAWAADAAELSDLNGTLNLTFKLLHPEADGTAQGSQEVLVLLAHPEAGRHVPAPLADVALDVHKHVHGGDTVHANTTAPVHAGNGIWAAETNLTEDGTWSVHVEATLPGGTVHSVRFHVEVGAHDHGDDHDHDDHG